MKLQIDTEQKTIKVESRVLFKDLIETLKKLFPNNEWKDFELETNVIINTWSNPIIIKETIPVYPKYPWYCCDSINENKMLCMNNGVYNVETE